MKCDWVTEVGITIERKKCGAPADPYLIDKGRVHSIVWQDRVHVITWLCELHRKDSFSDLKKLSEEEVLIYEIHDQ